MLPSRRALMTLAACAASASACQLVFGLDGFETFDTGTAGSGAVGSIGGSDGGGAGMPTTSSGPGGCDCGLDPIWSPVVLLDQGDAAGTLPSTCGDQSAPINVFTGEKPGTCSSCSCTASGCEPPGLECFSAAACPGSGTLLDPSSTCGGTGSTGWSSCRVAGPIDGTCTPSGGVAVTTGPPFEQYLSFCTLAACADACAATCVATPNVPAGGCPAAFPHHYELPTSGTVACEGCTCSASCGADTYQGGTINCNDVSISGTSCTDVSPIVPMYNARFSAVASCTTNHDATFDGTVELGALHTICCENAIDGIPEAGG